MQSPCRILVALIVGLPLGLAQNVGSGSPNTGVNAAFLAGYYRNNFANLVSLPPITNVEALGTAGYVQQFNDANKDPDVTYALVVSTGAGPDNNYQLYPAIYAYYQQLGVIAAGYPTNDTQQCPVLANNNSCTYQSFSTPSVLFAYTNPIGSGGTTFFISNPFYSTWQSMGGIYSVGPATSAQTPFTSAAGNTATVQTYSTGLIANITSGNVSPRVVGVAEPVWDVYLAQGGYTGPIGLPLTAPLLQSNGHMQQMFENGSIDYIPNVAGSAVYLLPVKSILLAPAPATGTLQLNEGQTAALTATAYGVDGSVLAGRVFTWNTTSGLIVSIQPNGSTATIKAVGGGAATITVSAEGVVSNALNVFVTAPCCAVGQGAPTTALQQSFQNAIIRDQLNPVLPALSPVTQVGAGYLQQFLSASTGAPFWLAASQATGNAYLLQGPLLIAYQSMGGPTGLLGYPLSDPTTGGRQNFEGGALAGTPIQLVTGAILTQWASLGYETGPAGNPTTAATPFLTFRATSGTAQTFTGAMIFAIASGPQAGNVYSIAGPILAAYTGPGSNLGVPTDAEYSLNGLEQQDFEGGYMQYSPGDTVAQIYLAPLVPTVTATPASAPAGSVVRLTLGGFNPNAQVSVSISGQQSFIATVPTGAYVWQTYIPANAASSTVTINATDTNSQASAQASYSIRGAASANISLQTVRGDQQTGLPGATLTLPIQVQLADNSGVPIPNANVYFTPSPGGAIANGSSVTESNGMASVNWRLPPQDGLAILSVDAGGYLISASASAAHSGLPNFPVMSQAGVSTVLGNGASPISSSGALLVSAAAALLYYQNRGDLPQPDGPANAPSLNAFLKTACGTDSTGAPVCDGFIQPAGASDQIVNLWRLGGFVGNAVTIRTITPDQNLIRDSIAQGAPVILALTLTVNGAPGGSHFVVATGVDASGNLNLMDPNPAYAQGSLYGYLNGFQSSTGQTISGVLSGAAVVTPQVPANPGFLIAVNAPLSVQSPAGQCGAAFSFPISNGAFALQYCDESAGQFYELDLAPADSNTNFQGTFIDLSSFSADSIFSGTGATSYSINGSSGQWMFAPLAVQFQASNVVEQANPAGGLAPGALASITGTGLTTPGSPPVVTVNGETAQLINATPFELDFQIPMDAAAGSAVLDVTSDVDGSEEQTITLQPVAPAIQILPGGLGLITNQDGSANTPYNPALRGQTITVFGSGFGTLPASVQAFVGGTPVTVSSVSQAPNSPGLFELSIAIPATLPPGSSLSLVLGQGPAISNAVNIAIQ